MTEKQAGEVIAEAWAAGWLALHPGSALPYDTGQAACVPFVLDDETFDESNPANLGALGAWVAVNVVTSIANQGSMGPPGSVRWQTKGYIAVTVNVPANAGAGLRRALCDDVRTVLQGKSFAGTDSSIPTFAGTTRNAGKTTDGKWYYATVVVPFYYWA